MPSWEPADRIKAKLNRAKFKKESLAMPEAKRDEVPLPEPHGYVGACNQYCIQPKDSPLMWEKLNRWTADQLREYGRQCVQAALESTAAELEAMRKDAERYRWLRDLKCNSFTLGRDDDHACNYMSASEWIDNNPDWFRDDDPKEIERMREANTIWRLQVYPNTPVGFNAWNASTLDAAIDAALTQGGK